MIKLYLIRAAMIIAFILILIIILSLFQTYVSLRPARVSVDRNPKNINLNYEDIILETEDNLKLKGWFIKSNQSRKAIILLHGYPFNRAYVLDFASFLKDYNLLFFDFRGLGESQGHTTGGLKETIDVDAAVKFLKEREIENIGILGFSLGASTAILSAEKNKNIKVVVADSPYANLHEVVKSMYRFSFLKLPFVYCSELFARIFFGLNVKEVNVVKAIKNTDIPILLIHGGKDSQINVKNSKILKENAKNQTKVELWIVEEANHGMAYFLEKENYENKVLNFFKKNL